MGYLAGLTYRKYLTFYKIMMKNSTIKKIHLENMRKIIGIFILLSSSLVQAQDNQVFLALLTKCVVNELDMNQSGEFKILAAPEMNIICSREGKINCKIMKKESAGFKQIAEQQFEVYADIGDVGEIRSKPDAHQSLVLNQRLKKAMYFSKEITRQNLIRETICSGELKDSQEIKKLISPPASEKTYKPAPRDPNNEMLPKIGE